VTFRAVDVAGKFGASANKTITFVAQRPPRLSIGMAGGNVVLSFTSRANLVYDPHVCTHLEAAVWHNVEPYTSIDGDGGAMLMINPVTERVRGFYRLVEYR